MLPFSVEQDMVELPELTACERLEGEYRTMGLHPNGHVMAHLRPQLAKDVLNSQEVLFKNEGEQVRVAGMVIRRQHPQAEAYFLTLEDEFGHIPLIVWRSTYQRLRHMLREPFVVATGVVSRREGTLNVIVAEASPLRAIAEPPKAKSWG